MTRRTARNLAILSLGFAVLAAGATAAWAHGPGMRGGPLRGILRDLDLSDTQKEQVKTMFRDARPRLQPLAEAAARARRDLFAAMTAPTFDEAAVRAAAEAVGRAAGAVAVERAQVNAQLRTILTPEQHAKLDETLRRMLDRMERRGLRARQASHERASDLIERL